MEGIVMKIVKIVCIKHFIIYFYFMFVFFFSEENKQRDTVWRKSTETVGFNLHSLRQSEFYGLDGTGLGCTNHTTDVQYFISKATTKWKTWPQTVCSNAHVACIFKHERTNFQPKTLSTQQ